MGMCTNLIKNYPREIGVTERGEKVFAEMRAEEVSVLVDIVEKYVNSVHSPQLREIISSKVFDYRACEALIDIVRLAKEYEHAYFGGWNARGNELTLELMSESVEIKEGDKGKKAIVKYMLTDDCLGTIVYALIAWIKRPIDVVITSDSIPLFTVKPSIFVPIIGVHAVINGQTGLMQKLIWHEVANDVFVATFPRLFCGLPGDCFELYLTLETSKYDMEVRTFGFNVVKARKLEMIELKTRT